MKGRSRLWDKRGGYGVYRSSLCTVAQYALTFSAYAGANGATEATINTILKLFVFLISR